MKNEITKKISTEELITESSLNIETNKNSAETFKPKEEENKLFVKTNNISKSNSYLNRIEEDTSHLITVS